jgi:hypothetical protein
MSHGGAIGASAHWQVRHAHECTSSSPSRSPSFCHYLAVASMRMRFAAMLVVARLACGQVPPYTDPPFDLSRVLFSAAFSDDMVLQRAPQMASVLGTATPGAFVTVRVTGPANYSWTSAPAPVTSAPSDASLHGTWKALLPARAAGFGYDIEATCAGCPNATAATLAGVGFGDVLLCSGQVRHGLPAQPHSTLPCKTPN